MAPAHCHLQWSETFYDKAKKYILEHIVFLISAAIYIKIETGCEPFHAQKSTGTWYIFPYQSDENVYLKQNHKDIRDLWSLLSSEEKR